MQVASMKNTLTIDINEIGSLELHCPCGAFVSHPVSMRLSDHVRCQSCGQVMLQSDAEHGKNTSIQRLVQALANWRDNPDNRLKVTFTVEPRET